MHHITNVRIYLKAKYQIKADFNLKHTDNVFELMDHYDQYYNYERPTYALDYKTPIQYRIEQGY